MKKGTGGHVTADTCIIICHVMYVINVYTAEGQDEVVAVLRTKLIKSLIRHISHTSYLYPWSNFVLKTATTSY